MWESLWHDWMRLRAFATRLSIPIDLRSSDLITYVRLFYHGNTSESFLNQSSEHGSDERQCNYQVSCTSNGSSWPTWLPLRLSHRSFYVSIIPSNDLQPPRTAMESTSVTFDWYGTFSETRSTSTVFRWESLLSLRVHHSWNGMQVRQWPCLTKWL